MCAGGDELTFEVLECLIDGKRSKRSDLSEEEAKQIKWIIKEATRQPSGQSFKLVVGRELATGTGATFDYTVTSPAGSAVVAMAYVNAPSQDVAQWVKISTNPNFQPSNSTHMALTTTFPEITEKEKLEEPFKAKWLAFSDALEAAGAFVDINSTLRSLGRAYMMHYCERVANGTIKPWEVPDGIVSLGQDTGPVGMEWSHTTDDGRVDVAKSKRAASQMMRLFEIAYPASLTSNHVKGKAIDVYIEWTGTLKIQEKDSKDKDGKTVAGKEHEIKSTPRHGGTKSEPAGNKELRAVAETYGIYKNIKDAPHWSAEVGGK